MKKIKLIYNPFAGDTTFKNQLDDIVEILQGYNWYVSLFRVTHYGDIDEHFKKMDKNYYDAIAVSGGDGTINLALNAMIKNGLNIPLGIFPSGTANDFASYIGIPKDPVEAAKVIGNGVSKKVDIGKINNDYFINVVCSGLFAKISQGVDPVLKNSIGKLAYYLKGAEAIANIKPVALRVTTSTSVIEVNTILLLIMNTSGAGGFNNLAPASNLADGKFDLLIYKSKGNIAKDAKPFIQSLRGTHIKDENVIYLQDSYFKIELVEEESEFTQTDIDGERGPDLPIEVKVMEGMLTLFLPDKE
ncbi:MAG: diacylglycerol/lipid kinase family protein [Lachnospirales bacterium]